MARTLRDRFEIYVDRTGEHHLWTGATRPNAGTGRMRVDGKEIAAHQIAWELERGPLPKGKRVLPCADVPACVRVDHLRTTRGGATSGVRSRARKGAREYA